MSARAWLARWSHYTSLACIHGDCRVCPQWCRTCGRWCSCDCHQGVRQPRWKQEPDDAR